MSDLATLAFLVERAARERDDAARRVAQARIDVDAAHGTRASLETYRGELRQRAPTVRGTPFATTLLGHFGAFDRRLDSAIVEQGRHAERFQRIAQHAQQELVDRQRRLHSLQALVQRRHAAAAAAEQRRDQKSTDETAARLHAMGTAFSTPGTRRR